MSRRKQAVPTKLEPGLAHVFAGFESANFARGLAPYGIRQTFVSSAPVVSVSPSPRTKYERLIAREVGVPIRMAREMTTQTPGRAYGSSVAYSLPEEPNRNVRSVGTQVTTRPRSYRGAALTDIFSMDELANLSLQPGTRTGITEEGFKKGGQVKKTGLALVHKGEVVVPATRVKEVDAALKKAGKRPLKK